MSKQKKDIRAEFRRVCLERSGPFCEVCAVVTDKLDVHHITPRKLMPGGGYVRSNGIALCSSCHELAEAILNGEETSANFNPQALYSIIGSSYERALADSEASA